MTAGTATARPGAGAAGHGHRPAVVLLAHGSPDPRHARDIWGFADRLSLALRQLPDRTDGPSRPARRWRAAPLVTVAFLDHHGPTPSGCGELLTGEQVSGAVVVPMFTARAYHVAVDVPGAVAAIARAGSAIRLLEPGLAGSAELVDAALTPAVRAGRAAVLLAAGSSNLQACRLLREQVRRLSGSTGVPLATALLSGGPGLGEALSDLGGQVAGGPGDSRVPMVVPFVVADGILRDRMAALAQVHGLELESGSLTDAAPVVDLVARLLVSGMAEDVGHLASGPVQLSTELAAPAVGR